MNINQFGSHLRIGMVSLLFLVSSPLEAQSLEIKEIQKAYLNQNDQSQVQVVQTEELEQEAVMDKIYQWFKTVVDQRSLDSYKIDTDISDHLLKNEENFNPSLFPLQRNSVFNQVNDQGEVFLEKTRFRKLFPKTLESIVTAHQTQGNQIDIDDFVVFHGKLQIKTYAGQKIKIPSVHPQQRFLSFKVKQSKRNALEVSRDFSFWVDDSYQYYVEDQQGENLRLEWQVAVHKKLLIETQDSLSFYQSFPNDDRFHLRLPEKYKTEAKQFIEEMKWFDDVSFEEKIKRLIKFYRFFRSDPFTEDEISSYSSEYLLINYSQNGACRHRAFAFMITARALGIPTNMVVNDAHAFVEILMPNQTWKIIDLGGSPSTIELSNTHQKDKIQLMQRNDFFTHINPQEIHPTILKKLMNQPSQEISTYQNAIEEIKAFQQKQENLNQPQGSTPQGSTPQGSTPQGSTPQGSTPQGSTSPEHQSTETQYAFKYKEEQAEDIKIHELNAPKTLYFDQHLEITGKLIFKPEVLKKKKPILILLTEDEYRKLKEEKDLSVINMEYAVEIKPNVETGAFSVNYPIQHLKQETFYHYCILGFE
jgi:hypothetical protein